MRLHPNLEWYRDGVRVLAEMPVRSLVCLYGGCTTTKDMGVAKEATEATIRELDVWGHDVKSIAEAAKAQRCKSPPESNILGFAKRAALTMRRAVIDVIWDGNGITSPPVAWGTTRAARRAIGMAISEQKWPPTARDILAATCTMTYTDIPTRINLGPTFGTARKPKKAPGKTPKKKEGRPKI